MTLNPVAAILSQRVGFDARTLSDRKLSRAIEQRRRAGNDATLDEYLQRLQTSTTELHELIEHLVVPETWFFRDRKPFDYLMNIVRSDWLPSGGSPKLRLLSIPCSTGEEPYSIAIALLEAGLSPHRFSIDAVDISQQALTKAQQASYSKNSFRGNDWVERSRYFQWVEGRYVVNPVVRQTVQFRQGNILEQQASIQPKYNIIFCRNLLIYLEAVACQQALQILHGLLYPRGFLFVGASETGKVPGNQFEYLRQSFTFSYRKRDVALTQARQAVTPQKRAYLYPTKSSSLENEFGSPLHRAAHHSDAATRENRTEESLLNSGSRNHLEAQVRPNLPEISAIHPELEKAKKMADAGHFDAAIHACKNYLESHILDVEAYILLGILYQAIAQDDQAERCYQKALYLQPNCSGALIHLSLLKQSRGDTVAAQRLQQRLKKAN
jgi:chemotaxis protein methyltransferase WspC